ncbi:MAG: CerR family C-terminal domain-containing protein [Desulfococcaceae bacterium]
MNSNSPKSSKEDPRHRLIDAGLEIFGTHGFEGATTRMLAAKAGVNQAAIPYYYGGKEGLYHAVVAYIAENAGRFMLPVTEKITAALQTDDLSTDAAVGLLVKQLSAFIQLVGQGESRRWGRIIIREQMQPTKAFDIIYDHVIRRVHEACAGLIGHILQIPPASDTAIIRAHSVVGQAMIFQAARETILRRLGRREFTLDDIEMIRSIVEDQIRNTLRHSSGK